MVFRIIAEVLVPNLVEKGPEFEEKEHRSFHMAPAQFSQCKLT